MEDVASLAGAMLKLPDSVVIVDENGNVAWGNSSAQRLFGRSLADAVGISGLSLVHPGRPGARAPLAHLHSGQGRGRPH